MGLEIERKFLIQKKEFKKFCHKKKHIIQGFLNSNKNRIVRVRIIDNEGFITIKGISDKSGTTRFEWEKNIPLKEAKELMNLCEKGIIEKIRHYHTFGGNIFEIDEFLGTNEGLIVAEIELNDKSQDFLKPDYLGEEVTNDKKYYNSNLSKNSYKTWK